MKTGSFILLLLLVLVVSGAVIASAPEPYETSIILLVCNYENGATFQEPFFELIDLENYVLVPAIALSSHLDYAVKFKREENSLILANRQDPDKGVIIDLTRKEYRVNKAIKWAEEPPVYLDGEFYITPKALECLLDVSISWSPRLQELIITGIIPPKQQEEQADEAASSNLEDKQDPVSTQEPVTGPNVSIGTIQYKLVSELRLRQNERKTANSLLIDSTGRLGPWSITLSGTARMEEYDTPVLELPFMKAKYRRNEAIVVVGDETLELKDLGKSAIRGIIYMNPEYQGGRKLIATTSISGQAQPGSTISLFVNGTLIEKVVAESKTYTLRDIPLSIKRLNRIRIVLERPDGETDELVRTIAASPRLIQKGSRETLAAYGHYRKPDDEYWQGTALAIRTQLGISEGITLNWEASRKQPKNPPSRLDFSDLGIAFRLGDQTIVSLDWIVRRQPLEDSVITRHGFEASILYCLEHAFIESIMFFTPRQTKYSSIVHPAHGIDIIAEWELSELTTIKARGGFHRSSLDDKPYWGYAEAELTRFWGVDKQHKSSVSAGIQQEHDSVSSRKFHLDFKHRTNTSNISHEEEVGLFLRRPIGSSETMGETSVNVHGEMVTALSQTLLWGGSLEGHVSRSPNFAAQYLLGSELKWGKHKTFIAGNVSVQGTDAGISQGAIGTAITQIIAPGSNIWLELSHTRSANQPPLSSLGLGAQFWKENLILSSDFSITLPSTSNEWRWEGDVSATKYFTSGLGIGLQAGKLYDVFGGDEPEYLLQLSLSQALGFGSGRINTSRYQDTGPASFVAGYVYLDENNNGKRDDTDELVKDITVPGQPNQVNTPLAMFDREYTVCGWILTLCQPTTYRSQANS